ncbi:MAG: polysaccharide lyase family 7 protein [Bacteroidales bacterium]|nr:polysaccharide lyase family 7 protein [Bacteroidales bacterium]
MRTQLYKILLLTSVTFYFFCNKPLAQEDIKEDTSLTYPSDIIGSLARWKLTLTGDGKGFDSSEAPDFEHRNTNPLEVIGGNLLHYEYRPYFYADINEIVFKAPCSGATTKGSKYPRCELRQLVGGGNNYWSVNDYQFLQVVLRVIHTPKEKPNVCITKIHGPEQEPLRIHYDANKGLYLVWNHTNHIYLKDKLPYTLGQKLRITVNVNKAVILCSIFNINTNKSFSYKWISQDNTGYFKVGCYTQSSIFLSEIKEGYKDELPDAYGEVHLLSIDLKETY